MYIQILDKRGAVEPSGAHADFQVQLKLKIFKICPLHSGTCINVTHQTQSMLTAESPMKVNPSPLNNLILRCGEHTDIPLLPAEVELAAAVSAASQNGD